MPLDNNVEAAVRDAYAAIMDRDLDGTIAAIEDLAGVGVLDAVRLAELLLPATLWWTHDRHLPTPDEVRALAQRVVEEESTWANLPPVPAFEALMLRASGHPHNGQFDAEDVTVILVFAVANLLRHARADWPWHESLDIIEEYLEESR